MPEAFEIWSEVEKKYGKPLIKKCGLLTIDEPPYADVAQVITNVRGVGKECIPLSAEESNKRFPGLNFSPDDSCALEQDSGLIDANSALKAMQEQFVEFGGILHDREKVLDIEPGTVVSIKTVNNTYKARSVVITVGPWVNKVLNPLGVTIPLSIQRMSVCYWPVTEPHLYSADKFPAYIFCAPLGCRKTHVYGFPINEYPGLIKICPHKGTDIPSADHRDSCTPQKDPNVQFTAEVIKARFPGVKPEPSIVESCIYSVTPDHLFVMDKHPEFRNIVIGAGFSGHGFKMAPVVGKILSQMALGEKVSYDVLPFRLSRFTSFGRSKSSL